MMFKCSFMSVSRLASVVGLSFVAMGCDGAAAGAPVEVAVAAVSANVCPPPAPDPSLAVPSGNRLAFDFDATGVQIYTCAPSGPGFAWTFVAPEATLLNPGGQTAGIHFAGPTWRANDGSQVVGARVAGVTVDPSAIPWLLLSAASHSGNGRMAKVSFIQRFDTVGGKAPATGCDATTVGATARVDYQATYFFYEPKHGNPNGPPCP